MKCDKNGACKKAFEDKAAKKSHGHHHHHGKKPAKPANDQCPAPAKPKDGGACCPGKKDKCCP